MGQELTPREEQVFEQLKRGMPLKVIAIDLGLHPSTVSMHVGSAARVLSAVPDRSPGLNCAFGWLDGFGLRFD